MAILTIFYKQCQQIIECFLLLTNNVRVLVIFKRIIVTIYKKDKQLEYIFLEIYHTQNGLYINSVCFYIK